MTLLPPGKLTPALLKAFLAYLPRLDEQLLIPPGIGLDGAGIRWNSPLLSMTMDPITLVSHDIARYCVSVNINDIVCLGCKPRYFSSTVLLPLGSSENLLLDLAKTLGEELRRYELQATTGHIEVTAAVNAPVMIGHMIGQPLRDHFLDPRQVEAGDAILMYQTCGIEGTIILASRASKKMSEAERLRQDPGICIWPAMEPLLRHPEVIALHDPTEGGVATALHELADAAELGFEVDVSCIPILPVTQLLCDEFGLNPLGLLASGSALVVCRPHISETLIQSFQGKLNYIGEMTAKACRNLPRFEQDEILKVQLQ